MRRQLRRTCLDLGKSIGGMAGGWGGGSPSARGCIRRLVCNISMDAAGWAQNLGVELAAEVQGTDLPAELHGVPVHYEADVGGLHGALGSKRVYEPGRTKRMIKSVLVKMQ